MNELIKGFIATKEVASLRLFVANMNTYELAGFIAGYLFLLCLLPKLIVGVTIAVPAALFAAFVLKKEFK